MHCPRRFEGHGHQVTSMWTLKSTHKLAAQWTHNHAVSTRHRAIAVAGVQATHAPGYRARHANTVIHVRDEQLVSTRRGWLPAKLALFALRTSDRPSSRARAVDVIGCVYRVVGTRGGSLHGRDRCFQHVLWGASNKYTCVLRGVLRGANDTANPRLHVERTISVGVRLRPCRLP